MAPQHLIKCDLLLKIFVRHREFCFELSTLLWLFWVSGKLIGKNFVIILLRKLHNLQCYFIKHQQLLFNFSFIVCFRFIICSGVECSDTVAGAQCGPCPRNYEGDGKTCQQRRNPCHDNPCAAGTKKDIHVVAT